MMNYCSSEKKSISYTVAIIGFLGMILMILLMSRFFFGIDFSEYECLDCLYGCERALLCAMINFKCLR